METEVEDVAKMLGVSVLTVPMRNGNAIVTILFSFSVIGSYRTYEEWKLPLDRFEVFSNLWVLTVPMRNGNFINKIFYNVF